MKMEKKRAVMMESTAELRKKLMKEKNKTPLVEKKSERPKIGVHIQGHIIPEILLRLPARSLGKFRCVSKSWLSITSNTAFVKANTQHNLITRRSLIIGECDRMIQPKKPYLASAEANSKPAIRLQPMESMPGNSYIMASCDGLLCVRSFEDAQHYISNPLTGQSIPLPLDRLRLICKLGFYFHPSTSKYRLIRFKIPAHESEVLVLGESSWRRIPGGIPSFFHCECPLDLSGKLYWLAHTRSKLVLESELPPDIIVIFDEEEEVYSVICPPPSKKLQEYLGGNLVNFNGELGLWVVGLNDTIDLWIMENFWIKRYSVNAHIPKCPSRFKAEARSLTWILGGAISIGDEELLLDLSTIMEPHYLVRWNLKSGACVLRHLIDLSSSYHSTFPYTETLINPH